MELNIRDGSLKCLVTNIREEDTHDTFYIKLLNLIHYFSDKFMEMELLYANEFMLFAEDFYNRAEFGHIKNPYLDGIFIDIGTQKSLLRLNKSYSNQKDFTISPFEEFYSSDLSDCIEFRYGMGIARIIRDKNQFNGYLTILLDDALLQNEFPIYWVFSQVEAAFYNDDLKYPNGKIVKNFRGKDTMSFFHEYNYLCENLHSHLDIKMNQNKGVRIDRLKIDNMNILEYIFTNMNINNFSSQDLFKVCLKYGKPHYQMKSYLEKNKILIL